MPDTCMLDDSGNVARCDRLARATVSRGGGIHGGIAINTETGAQRVAPALYFGKAYAVIDFCPFCGTNLKPKDQPNV